MPILEDLSTLRLNVINISSITWQGKLMGNELNINGRYLKKSTTKSPTASNSNGEKMEDSKINQCRKRIVERRTDHHGRVI